jgi:hypothetical protein
MSMPRQHHTSNVLHWRVHAKNISRRDLLQQHMRGRRLRLPACLPACHAQRELQRCWAKSVPYGCVETPHPFTQSAAHRGASEVLVRELLPDGTHVAHRLHVGASHGGKPHHLPPLSTRPPGSSTNNGLFVGVANHQKNRAFLLEILRGKNLQTLLPPLCCLGRKGWDPREPRSNKQGPYESTRKQLFECLVWMCAPALLYEVVDSKFQVPIAAHIHTTKPATFVRARTSSSKLFSTKSTQPHRSDKSSRIVSASMFKQRWTFGCCVCRLFIRVVHQLIKVPFAGCEL